MSQESIHNTHEHGEHHSPTYGSNVLVWLALLSLTVITVSIAGIDLGGFTLFAALLIATIKASLVVNIFMHIKFDDLVFKVFLGVCILILIVVFLFTSFDVFYR